MEFIPVMLPRDILQAFPKFLYRRSWSQWQSGFGENRLDGRLVEYRLRLGKILEIHVGPFNRITLRQLGQTIQSSSGATITTQSGHTATSDNLRQREKRAT
jgi:hypothetical protein